MIHENSNTDCIRAGRCSISSSKDRSLPWGRPSDLSHPTAFYCHSLPVQPKQTRERKRERRPASFRTWPVQQMLPWPSIGWMQPSSHAGMNCGECYGALPAQYHPSLIIRIVFIRVILYLSLSVSNITITTLKVTNLSFVLCECEISSLPNLW